MQCVVMFILFYIVFSSAKPSKRFRWEKHSNSHNEIVFVFVVFSRLVDTVRFSKLLLLYFVTPFAGEKCYSKFVEYVGPVGR